MERKLIRVLFILLTIILFLAIGYFVTGQNPMENTNHDKKESFERNYKVIDTKYPIPSTGLVQGYYQVDEKNMAQLPYNNYVGHIPIYNNIPNGYYVVDIPEIGKRMARIPSGYILDNSDDTKTTIIPVTKVAQYAENPDKISGTSTKSTSFRSGTVNSDPYIPDKNTKKLLEKSQYKLNDFDVQYHDNISDMNSQMGIYDISFANMYVYDKQGNRIILPHFLSQSSPTYYQPGSFIFGSSGYVPNYEDSVYLSKTTGLSTLKRVEPESTIKGGFCNQYKASPLQMEQKCNSIDKATCASTDCCVLFGGSKCVSGNKKGPYMKSVFTDPSIKNKDVYYFKGECYGNCI
jgi:hypothetical protein